MISVAVLDAQVVINEPHNGIVTSFKNQFIAGNAPAGTTVVLLVNGEAVDSTTVRPDGVFEFIGIPVPEGPVKYTIVNRLRNGKEYTAERTIHRLGSPAIVEVLLPSNMLVADGSKITVTAKVFDKWGMPLQDGYFVTMLADSVLTEVSDVDSSTYGAQARLQGGLASFTFRAPSQATIVRTEFRIDNAVKREEIEFNTPVVPLMIVGSADASATTLSTAGDLSNIKNKEKIDAGFHSNGRLAFYGRGTVWDKYLLTASYDNERRQRDRLFRDLDPDVLYSIYGDNSRVDYTAQASNPFFVKLERNRSYVMFGDFNTAFAQSELARYDRTFTGVSGHYETREEKVDAFATLTDRKVVQDEIRGQGISGFYFLGSSNVVPGSEKVRIETRDKRHNEIVISRYDKSRFGDYEIDYVQGTLFFKQPIPSIDQNGNPVFIIVAYESQGGFANSYVTGIQGEKQILNGLTIGATAVTEERTPKNYSLFGFTTRYQYNSLLNVNAEIAHGAEVNNSGAAWKLEVSGSPVERMQLKSYFRKVENGFVNQTAGAGVGGNNSQEIGSTKYGIGGTYDGLFETKLTADYYRTEQSANMTNVVINSITGGAERKIGQSATIAFRVENLRYESVRMDTALTDNRQSTLLNAKTTLHATNRLNVTGEFEHSISNSAADEVKPSNGAIGVEYKAFDNVVLTAQQRFYFNNGSTSIFGIGSDLGYGTTVNGRYEIGNGINGKRNQASIGLKNTTKLTEDITSNVQLERTRALDRNLAEARTTDNDALSVGFEYLPKQSYKASIKGEVGKSPQALRRNLTFGGDIRVANDFTLIDKFSYYEEDRRQPQDANRTFADGTLSVGQIGSSGSSGLLKKVENVIGLAYRPVEVDWLNAIGKYEKKVEFNGLVSPQTAYNVDIVSLHTFIEPIIGLEIGTKYALKLAQENAFGLSASTVTDFYLLRAEYDLQWNGVDVAAEYRILNSRIANQANSNSIKNGYSAEVGYIVFDNIRIGLGYNFIGTEDRDLIGKDYWSAGPYLSFRMKFTEKILDYFNR